MGGGGGGAHDGPLCLMYTPCQWDSLVSIMVEDALILDHQEDYRAPDLIPPTVSVKTRDFLTKPSAYKILAGNWGGTPHIWCFWLLLLGFWWEDWPTSGF